MNASIRVPDAAGRFGPFGGRYVPETLTHALDELTAEYEKAVADPKFHEELAGLYRHYVGRPSPLYFAERLSGQCGGAQIYLKREDLNHTGAHKINNTLGQALLTLRMGKRRVIAETGAGQHGVATATACARFGLECVVYMGEEDIRRQRPNVFSMKLLGAEVRPVTQRLAHAPRRHQRGLPRLDELGRNHALLPRLGRRAASRSRGSSAISSRSSAARRRQQCLEQLGRLPDVVVACVGGGSNAAGMFYPFVADDGRGPGGRRGGRAIRPSPATMPPRSASAGPACCTAASATCSRTTTARPCDVHSVSAGLDYPGAGPGAQLLERHGPGRATPAPATTRPWRPSTPWPAAKASCRPWKAPTPWPRP